MLLISFSVGHSLLDMQPTLKRNFVPPVRLPWRKLSFQLQRLSTEVASGLGIGTCEHFSFLLQDPIWCRPMKTLSSCVHGSYHKHTAPSVIMCTWILLLSRALISWHPPPLWSSYSSCLLFLESLVSPEGRDLVKTSCLRLSIPRSLTLCIMSTCGFLYLFPCTAGRSYFDAV